MKKFFKLFGFAALVAAIGFSFVGCDNGAKTPPDVYTETYYSVTYYGNGNTGGAAPIDSMQYLSGATVTVLGNTGNLVKTGNTFAGWNTSANGSGTSYSAGRTFNIYASTVLYAQWTSSANLSLDGIWVGEGNFMEVTVSGSKGVISTLGTLNTLGESAKSKGYIKLGDSYWWNLTSTGSLTWSGQQLTVSYNTSAPTVATGTGSRDTTFTMSANGQTLTVSNTYGTDTFTRKVSGNYSLDGVWGASDGSRVTVSGSTGVISAFPSSPNLFWTDAINKHFINIGDQQWKSLTSTGNLKWSGQSLVVCYNTNTPNVADGTTWGNATFTMSADGQTITLVGQWSYKTSSGTVNETWTRVTTPSLDGVWGVDNGFRVTVSGSTGVISALGVTTPLHQSAIDKGYYYVGGQFWRNITSTGALTWSGQVLNIQYNTSSPNVAIGTIWRDATFTMNANGQTITVVNSAGTAAWTRY